MGERCVIILHQPPDAEETTDLVSRRCQGVLTEWIMSRLEIKHACARMLLLLVQSEWEFICLCVTRHKWKICRYDLIYLENTKTYLKVKVEKCCAY